MSSSKRNSLGQNDSECGKWGLFTTTNSLFGLQFLHKKMN